MRYIPGYESLANPEREPTLSGLYLLLAMLISRRRTVDKQISQNPIQQLLKSQFEILNKKSDYLLSESQANHLCSVIGNNFWRKSKSNLSQIRFF